MEQSNLRCSPHDLRLLVTKLDLLPGTHHVKFIVDGDMQLSDELPTAVDYTNILVNYIEVSADDIPHDESAGKPPPQGLHPPLVHPPGVEKHDFAPQPTKDEALSKDPTATATTDDAEKRYISTTGIHYSDKIPQYLPDLDCDESTNRFRRSANHIADIPQPPSLPMFLGKSILNGVTPMKDDSSVLNMPNHTVLNHLATSSIKNDVLATSLTTRYRRKVSLERRSSAPRVTYGRDSTLQRSLTDQRRRKISVVEDFGVSEGCLVCRLFVGGTHLGISGVYKRWDHITQIRRMDLAQTLAAFSSFLVISPSNPHFIRSVTLSAGTILKLHPIS
jgi:5'-AMP-activated protein kinase beta subunit, interaction domain/Glycogen recognition site of AMP-activated protein kinase